MNQSSFGNLLRSKEGLDACDLLEQHLGFDESGLVGGAGETKLAAEVILRELERAISKSVCSPRWSSPVG